MIDAQIQFFDHIYPTDWWSNEFKFCGWSNDEPMQPSRAFSFTNEYTLYFGP